MEKINIAELLKDCPKGMELYSPLCGDCKLYDVNEYNIRIETPNKDTLISLYHDGKYCSGGEIMLFPKGKTTWEGFQRPFVDGDVVYHRFRDTIGIVMYDKDNFPCKICDVSKKGVFWYNEGSLIAIVERDYRFATEEEKQKLFDAIRANGYKWNAETKTLEKLGEPKFKDGDVISDSLVTCIFKGEGKIKGTVDYYCGTCGQHFHVKDSKRNPKVHYGYIVNYRRATEEEKAELFQAIKDNGYKWNDETKTLEKLIAGNKFTVGTIITNGKITRKICSKDIDSYKLEDGSYVFFNEVHKWELAPNKFDINTLKPYDKVLVRLTKDGVWNATFFSHYDKEVKWGCYPFVTTSSKSYSMCIPYEGNEHLLGTTDDCDEYYKSWK